MSKNVDTKYSRSNAEKAKPLFMGTCQFQIIVIVTKTLSYPRGLTRKLQGIDRVLAKVTSDVKLLKETLKKLRRIVDMQYGSKSCRKNAECSGTEITMTK